MGCVRAVGFEDTAMANSELNAAALALGQDGWHSIRGLSAIWDCDLKAGKSAGADRRPAVIGQGYKVIYRQAHTLLEENYFV
jgi:hypothetical protein